MPSSRPQNMSLLFDVWLLMHLAAGMLDDALEGTDLSGDDFGLYSLLRAFGPATPSDIARWTGMRPTTVSTALRRMAIRGHSSTTPHPLDRRSYLVGLNEAGVTAHRTAAEPFQAGLKRVTDKLGEDEHGLRLALQRLDAALRAAAGVDQRPYHLANSTAGQQPLDDWQLPYAGSPLTPAQEAAVRSYIDFVRTQSPS
jgi:DNA-binding MarR family transcriptional regulator